MLFKKSLWLGSLLIICSIIYFQLEAENQSLKQEVVAECGHGNFVETLNSVRV